MARPKEVTAILRKLSNARREVVRATERAAEVDDQIGLLPGHFAELLRRLREVQEEAERAVKVFESEEN